MRILFDAAPPWASGTRSASGQGGVSRAEELTPERRVLRYADGTVFWLDLDESAIWARWPAPLTPEDTATYLLGPVLGWYLRLCGHVCLHASAIVVDHRCVAFVGPAGSGKSTLAAGFATLGNAVLTEDVGCLEERGNAFWFRPGYPLIRLWEGSSDLLALQALPRLTPNWNKRYLELGDDAPHRFQDAPAPLNRIYILRDRQQMKAAAEIGALAGQEVLAELLANTYGQTLSSPEMRSREFGILGRLARSVPIRTLTVSADGSRLLEACEWIRRHALA
ncbi:MAG: hypothetical protein ACREQZ_01640 [Woeseiaceae bacterium]